eukprot:SM000118S25605  [mRNA]  locus=s118:329511:332159:+ [translate_table: standard]
MGLGTVVAAAAAAAVAAALQAQCRELRLWALPQSQRACGKETHIGSRGGGLGCHVDAAAPLSWRRRRRRRPEACARSSLAEPPAAASDGARAEASPSNSASADATFGGAGLYTPFVEHTVAALGARTRLWPFPIQAPAQDEYVELQGTDPKGGPAVARSTSLQAEKVRQFRAADISAGPVLQVLNLIIFPRPEYDLPYFCADLVTFGKGHLVVIDLNPLYNTEEYHKKYIFPVLPVCEHYSQSLPWGGEFTAESLQFFSPALLWARLPLEADVHVTVFEAYKAYLDAWLAMLDEAQPEMESSIVVKNQEAQHRYLSWRAEKDPGRPLLTRLFGAERCEGYIHNFLFDGLHSMGTKTFLDYFPEYQEADGSITRRRSVAGKRYSTRPWDSHGRLLLQTSL